ncbi:gamma-glutamylcyclotransferase family protein [Brevundimonas diminuta]|uniref:gamma-glutamylcyclotransferase family protein n=1 Tax=Brevundimonas diminuta TaxID=293 RepID=UPI003207B852
MTDILLFSYGTLQDPAVQKANFGRLLEGTADRLMGFVLSEVEITDPEVIAQSGLSRHPILQRSGDAADTVDGAAFHITADELRAADAYESADYQRVLAPMASGREAWVYIAA